MDPSPVPEAPRQTIRRDPRSSTHRDDGSPLQAGYGHEVFCVAWLLVTGMTLEMTLNDLVGSAMFQITIAVVKAGGLVLGLLCTL
ncbi:MAG: hypothetical protein ACJ8AW_12750, partial [Rhodopila sp.]